MSAKGHSGHYTPHLGHKRTFDTPGDVDPMDTRLAEKQAEIERIEDVVSHIRIPLTFSDQVYNLRSHIDIVRRKISSRNGTPGRIAAE